MYTRPRCKLCSKLTVKKKFFYIYPKIINFSNEKYFFTSLKKPLKEKSSYSYSKIFSHPPERTNFRPKEYLPKRNEFFKRKDFSHQAERTDSLSKGKKFDILTEKVTDISE